jgi:hypothetical protein
VSEDRTPHYHFHAMDKERDEKSRVGAAWKNDDGSITIKLDNFVHLIGNRDLVLRLFPNDKQRFVARAADGYKAPPPPAQPPLEEMDDDIPF